jgi:hypothetical protein
MKPGCRPPYVGARRGILPEHPHYWSVTEDIEPAVDLLVRGGEAEYEPVHATRGQGGQFVPALELQPVTPAAAPRASHVPNLKAFKRGQ